MKKFGRFIWGIILFPLAVSAVYHLPSALVNLKSEWHALALLFGGVLAYVLFEGLFNRPMRTYVFGHELTHALASIATGGKVLAFHVSEDGGSVELTKTGFFVALAPYCIPIYTVFILLAGWIAKFYWPPDKLQMTLLFAVGFTLAFHSSLTFYAVRQKQPDIHKTGFFFSMVFITLVNVWVLVLISKLLFWNAIALRPYFLASFRTQIVIWKWAGVRAWAASEWIRAHYFQGGNVVE